MTGTNAKKKYLFRHSPVFIIEVDYILISNIYGIDHFFNLNT